MTTESRIRAMLEDAAGEWVAKPQDIPKGTWGSVLYSLRAKGLAMETSKTAGTRLVATARTEDAPATPPELAPANLPGATADEAPASGPVPQEPAPTAGIVPFAGDYRAIDPEVEAIARGTYLIAALEEPARVRVLSYLANRFVP